MGIFLGGCAISPIENSDEMAENLAIGEIPNQWRATGRFAYKGETEQQSGQFDWQQNGSNYQVRLFGPMGMGSIRILGSELEIEIDTGEQSYRSDEPDALLYQMTGMNIPIKQMGLWMTGISSRDQNYMDWSIRYQDYQEVEQYQLPTRIDVENDTDSLRIAVSDWSLPLEN